jgi:hypothetical protein
VLKRSLVGLGDAYRRTRRQMNNMTMAPTVAAATNGIACSNPKELGGMLPHSSRGMSACSNQTLE